LGILTRDFPEEPLYQHALALVYWHLGSRKEAMDLMRRLTIKHPEFSPARQSMRGMTATLR
jgi:hypothetical protein